jgi:glycosyltransferase involved in cell wall biosynthesis
MDCVSKPPVLFVIIQSGALANGGISSISQIITRLKRRRPIVVTDRETGQVEEWRRGGIDVHVIPQDATSGIGRNPLRAIRSYWRYTRAIRQLVRSSGAKVIHANDPAAMQLSIAPAKLAGSKLAFNIRDTIDPERPPPRARYRALFAAADHVFYLSQDMADRWAEITPAAKSAFSVTYSVIDTAAFTPSPPYTGEGPPVVLISGLISPKKGQLEFLREVSPVLSAHGIATWIAGDFDSSHSTYMAACAEAAAKLEPAAQLLGYRTDIPRLMARSAVVAVASRYEGLVRAMIESMSCARPVVSFDICSAREMLECQSGGAGRVVDVGDYGAMADAIIDYCKDPDRAAEAGRKGNFTAARLFSGNAVVDRYERVYELLAGASQTGIA